MLTKAYKDISKYSELKVMPGALKAMKAFEDKDATIYIISSSPVKKDITVNHLREQGFLELVSEKRIICRENTKGAKDKKQHREKAFEMIHQQTAAMFSLLTLLHR